MVDRLENSPPDMTDYDNEEDEAFPPLPPPLSPGQGGQEDGELFADAVGEGSADVSNLADVPAAKRRVVKRPQPKLDSNRLTSDRGLPALRTLFDNVRFKGRGHEGEDLRLLMQKMENWAHRLYPKLQFDDLIDKVEKLGTKKEVQTCLKRIRLDMPLTHEDHIGIEGEEEAATEPPIFKDPETFSSGSFTSDLQAPIHSTPAPTASPALSLTEEQCKRIVLNRQQALERKLARQQQAAESPMVDESFILDKPPVFTSSKSLNNSQDLEEDLNMDPSSIIHNPHQLSPTQTDPSESRSEMTESGSDPQN